MAFHDPALAAHLAPVDLDADGHLHRGLGGDPQLQVLQQLLARLGEGGLDDQGREWESESVVQHPVANVESSRANRHVGFFDVRTDHHVG